MCSRRPERRSHLFNANVPQAALERRATVALMVVKLEIAVSIDPKRSIPLSGASPTAPPDMA